MRSRVLIVVLVAAVALLAYGLFGLALPPPDRVDGRLPRAIGGGTFEASGVAYVPGTNGVLFVDDATHREIFWMELAADGRQLSPATRVPLGADVADLEGMTFDGTSFYVVGSQSKTFGYEGDGLVRFRFDPGTRRIEAVETIQGVKAWLAQHVAELKGTERIIGDTALNIEAIAWDPHGRG